MSAFYTPSFPMAGFSLGLLFVLACAGSTTSPPPSAGARLPLDIRLSGPETIRDQQVTAFMLDFVVRNTGSATIDPRLGTSVLRVNGEPMKDWDVTINNGPRDARWEALPPGDDLHFTYQLGAMPFHGPGEYQIVLEAGGVTSQRLTVRVTPR